MLVFVVARVPDTTTAGQRRRQRATRLSALPADVQLLLLAETALPGQARPVGHVVRVRVLPAPVPDQEQLDHAQEPAAPGPGGRAQASDEGRRRCRRRRRGPVGERRHCRRYHRPRYARRRRRDVAAGDVSYVILLAPLQISVSRLLWPAAII